MSKYMEKVGGSIVEAVLGAVAEVMEASAQALIERDDSIALQLELLELVQLGLDSGVTVQDIKINEVVGFSLISLACVYLKRHNLSSLARYLPKRFDHPIVMTGPEGTEAYHQLIVKALANYFEAKLLILDVTNVVSKTEVGSLGKIINNDEGSSSWSAFLEEENKTPTSRLGSHGVSMTLAADSRKVAWKEEIFVDALFEVLATLSETSPVVVYFPDVSTALYFEDKDLYLLFSEKMRDLHGTIMILGSKIEPTFHHHEMIDRGGEHLNFVHSSYYDVEPPEENLGLVCWESQVEEFVKTILAQDYRILVRKVLNDYNLDCKEDLSFLEFGYSNLKYPPNIEEFVVYSLSHHLMNMGQPEYRNRKLVISPKSLSHALASLEFGKLDSNRPKTPNGKKGVEPDNDFEKDLMQELIPAGETGVKFQDIGALDNVKTSLQELVMLPLRRPEFFNQGGLLKPCKGILLFGPPGTGKTMLAKAVATEAGASFINVCMSSITSYWNGEDEKYVKALFTLAAKVAPTVVFIDEVDSMLGKRSASRENSSLRALKNEFMAHWDGLLTKSGKYVLVLAATNRPFDLDEAIIRRFERRIMVDLPDPANREKILRTILSKEELREDFNFQELAAMTEGYSGSDLRNLCTAAAYRRLREHLSNEEEENNETFERDEYSTYISSEIMLRPLSTEDIKEAMTHVTSSFAIEGDGMQKLRDWNDLYGEGGSGSEPKQQLSYFL